MDDILRRIISVLAKILDVNINKITIDSCIDNTRGWDSFVTVQFIVGIEKEFNIAVAMEDAENFISIGRVLEILSGKYLK